MSQDKKWYEGSHEEYWDRILSLPSPQSWELEHRYLIEALRERGEEIEDLGWTFDFWNSGGNTMLVMLWDKTSSEEWGFALAGDDQESSDNRIEEYPMMSLFRPDGETDSPIQDESDRLWELNHRKKIDTNYASIADGAINEGQAIRTKESLKQYVEQAIQFLIALPNFNNDPYIYRVITTHTFYSEAERSEFLKRYDVSRDGRDGEIALSVQCSHYLEMEYQCEQCQESRWPNVNL